MRRWFRKKELAASQKTCPPTMSSRSGVAKTLLQGPGDDSSYGAPTQVETGEAVDSTRLPESLVNRFTRIRLVGTGSTGAVYAAFDEDLERPVALKELTKPVSGRLPRLVAQREARAVAALQHPSIITLYDWIVGERAAWLVLEYVDGPTLADLLQKNGPLPASKAIEIVLQVCSALQYAHDRGVWHLDIKPSNILINGEGKAKLADFGIAQREEDLGVGWGTLGFAPPEQLAGKPGPQSDVYALGALLWVLLTGDEAPPEKGRGLRRSWSRVPRTLRPPLRAALSLAVRSRPKNPKALAEALKEAWEARFFSPTPGERAWNVGLIAMWSGTVAALTSSPSPISAISRGTAVWGAFFLSVVASVRPVLALFIVLTVLTAGVVVNLPTLGLLLIALWPVLIVGAKFSPRGLTLVLLAPVFSSLGLPALTSIMAGSVLRTGAAIWVAAGGQLAFSALQRLLTSEVVVRYLQEASSLEPASDRASAVFSFVLRVSPRDLIFEIIPSLWQGALAGNSLWLAMAAVIVAAGVAWGRELLDTPAMAGLVTGLLALYEGVSMALGAPFGGLHLLATFVLAMVVVELSPGRAAENRRKISQWLSDNYPIRR